jgi:hypothetical protein
MPKSVAQNNLILELLNPALWKRRFYASLVTSDAGALLLRATDRTIGMIDRFRRVFLTNVTTEED